jgi:outer membrane protein assembly factor BamB
MRERNPTRRQWLLAAGASGVAVLSGCISGGDGGSGDGNGSRQGENGDSGDDGSGDSGFTPWVSPYGDPQKTRSTPDPAPTDLESTTSYRVGGSVAVTDAGVFTLDRAVSRVDPSAGEIAFNRSVPVGRALFVQDGIVVCGERTGSGRVAGLDAETGERAWLVEPGGTVVPFPAGDGIGYAGSHIGVLDPASGDTRWDRDRSLLSSDQPIASYSFERVATHPESNTAFVYNDNEVLGIEAYDLTNGDVRWRQGELGGATAIPAAVRGDTVYVPQVRSGGNQVLALDRETGEEQWRADGSLTGRNATFAVDDDSIYIANGSEFNNSASVFALDPADGSEQWSTPVAGGTVSLIATGDALVRVGGRVELLSKTDGELQRSAEIDDTISPDAGKAVAGGRLYVPTAGIGGASGLLVYGTG